MVIYRIWTQETLHLTWKMLAMGLYVAGLLKFFTTKQLVRFMGYCMMLVGLKHIWHKQDINMIWKVAAVIAVLSQFYPFAKININILSRRR
jgi:hypothetical protein